MKKPQVVCLNSQVTTCVFSKHLNPRLKGVSWDLFCLQSLSIPFIFMLS